MCWNRVLGFLVAFLSCVGLRPASALAQIRTGSISGTVVTESGGPVEGATVTFHSTRFCEAELGYPCTYRSITDREGRFSVANLPSGQYVNICAEPPQPT